MFIDLVIDDREGGLKLDSEDIIRLVNLIDQFFWNRDYDDMVFICLGGILGFFSGGYMLYSGDNSSE